MKTGKIVTDDADYIQEDTSALQLATGKNTDKDFRPVPGMIRYNEDHEYVELYTSNYGWRFLSTEDMLRPPGSVDMKSGVMKVLQQVKKISTGTVHIQGGTGSGGIGSYNASSRSTATMSSPFEFVTGSSMQFKGLLHNEGPNFLLFYTGASKWNLTFNVDATTLIGLSSDQRYNFTYTSFAGLGGFSAKIMHPYNGIGIWQRDMKDYDGCKLNVDIKTCLLYTSPRPRARG